MYALTDPASIYLTDDQLSRSSLTLLRGAQTQHKVGAAAAAAVQLVI